MATLLFAFAIARMGYSLPESFGHFTPLDVLKQAFFVDRGVRFISAPFWTLPVEFRWYFVFPIMLWLWIKSPKAFAAIGALVFLTMLGLALPFDAVYFPAFLLGIVAADVHTRRVRFGWWPIAVCAGAVTYAALTPVMWYGVLDLIPLWYVASFAFVVAAGEFESLRKALSIPILTAAGIASYSIYLVHDPIVTFVCARGLSPALAALLGIAAGVAFWYVAERPFVYTPLRHKMIGALERIFSRCLQIAGVRRCLTLGDPPLPSLGPSEA